MSLPEFEISPLLEIAWALLQWSMKWTVLLSLLVFLGVLWSGAGDMLVEILKKRKTDRKEKRVSRITE